MKCWNKDSEENGGDALSAGFNELTIHSFRTIYVCEYIYIYIGESVTLLRFDCGFMQFRYIPFNSYPWIWIHHDDTGCIAYPSFCVPLSWEIGMKIRKTLDLVGN